MQPRTIRCIGQRVAPTPRQHTSEVEGVSTRPGVRADTCRSVAPAGVRLGCRYFSGNAERLTGAAGFGGSGEIANVTQRFQPSGRFSASNSL